MTRRVVTIIVMVVVAAGAAQAHDSEHVVAGVVELEDGLSLRIAASDVALGDAWLGGAAAVHVTLDCVETSWHQPVYPIPPYLPYHRVEASGIGDDGARYYVTLYDVVSRPAGFGDQVQITTAPGYGACGADLEWFEPAKLGDIAVA